MTMFRNAKNVVINDGQFNATDNRVIIGKSTGAEDVLEILLGHSALAGLLNAKERFDAPKCDEDTRISTLQALKEWIKEGCDTSSSSMLWLHGPAGVGKSALAQSLALLLQTECNHAASFFFSRTAPGRNDGDKLVATLAYQLAMNFPAIRAFIAENIKSNPAIFSLSYKDQMEKLIIDPLNKFSRSWWYRYNPFYFLYRWNQPRLIVVDGLDECNNESVQCDLLVTLAHAVQRLRMPFRFIVASRPESHILSTFELDPLFQGPTSINISRRNLGEDRDADEDITTFLCKAFQEIQRTHPLRKYLPPVWPSTDEIKQLVAKSSKNFIYPSTVTKYIKSPQHRPQECLKAILGLSSIPTRDKPYEPLDNLYLHIFSSTPDANKDSIQKIFDILVFPRKSDDGLDVLMTPAMIEKIFSFPIGHVEHVLGDLLCLITIVDYDTPIKVLHASLSDFLLDPERSGEFHVDIAQTHGMVARGYSTLLKLLNVDMQSVPGVFLDDEFNDFIDYFTNFAEHTERASVSRELVEDLADFDLVHCYDIFFSNRYLDHRAYSTCAQHLDRFFGLFNRKGFDEGPGLLYRHINILQAHILDNCPAARFMDELTTLADRHPVLSSVYSEYYSYSLHQDRLGYDIGQQVYRLKMLLDIDFSSSRKASLDPTVSPGLQHAHLVLIYLGSLKNFRVEIWDHRWVAIHVKLAAASLAQASHCHLLVDFLHSFGGRRVHLTTYPSLNLLDLLSRHHLDESEKLATAITEYLQRVERDRRHAKSSKRGSSGNKLVGEISVNS